MRTLIPNSTQIPDVILDHWMARLSGAEFKVVLYIARRTFGFGKESDTISLNQLSRGIRKRDGEQLDYGTGLSRSSVKAACASLVGKGILIKTQATVGGSDEPDQNSYRLNLYAPIQDDEPENPGEEPEGNPSDSPLEVGRKSAQVGQKSAHLKTASKPVEDVGQNLAHVGQKKPHLGQVSAYGGPISNPEVGQKLAPQETDQETEEQETATTAPTGSREGFAVVALTPSASPEEARDAFQLLVEQGFSRKDAQQLVETHPQSVIAEQIQWLDRRTATKNKLGLLRKAIEGRWPKPESKEETKKAVEREAQSQREKATIARRQEIASELRHFYSRLQTDAPEAFSTFTSYVQTKKAQQAERPLIKESPRRLEMVMRSFETEENQIALMVEFFKGREVPLKEFEQLIQTVPIAEVAEVFRTASP